MGAEWNLMTWREVAASASRKPVVLVPIGCVETQGPYTPVGMEHIMADHLARDVADQTGAVALPAIPFGHSDAFKHIPGTIYIRPEILTGYYLDVFSSIVRAGFDHILCLAYHIPNEPYVEQAARLLREQTGISIAWVNPGALAATYLKDFFDDPTLARGHGAEPGLSLMRYLCGVEVPDVPEAGQRAKSYAGFEVRGAGLVFEHFPVGMPLQWEELYPATGGFGDVTQGSEEVGQRLYTRIVDHLSTLVDRFAAADPRAPLKEAAVPSLGKEG